MVEPVAIFPVLRAMAVLFLAALSVAAQETPADFVVAAGGRDAWSGRLPAPNAAGTDGPFATVHRARDAVRAAKEREPRAYKVLIRGGVYWMKKPLVFRPEDSGAPEGEICYAAWPGERPLLSGGRVITPRERGTAIPAVRAGQWYFRQLFVNGRRAVRARHPDRGYLRTAGPLSYVRDPRAERHNRR